jgi:hypothetical protein
MIKSAAAIAILASAPLWCADSKAEAGRLLAEVKAATGGAHWDRIRTWHERGTFRAGDLTGAHEAWLDFRRLRAYTDDTGASAILGTIRDANGWNGKVSWSADQTGDVYIADSEEARSGAVGSTYLAAFAYLFPGRHRAELELKAPQTAEGKRFDVVQVSPRGVLKRFRDLCLGPCCRPVWGSAPCGCCLPIVPRWDVHGPVVVSETGRMRATTDPVQ